jgi:hypothetical protein
MARVFVAFLALCALLAFPPSPAQAADAAAAFHTVVPDPRLCPSPLCGGYWVARVNRPLTACADGSMAPRCYVAALDLSHARLSPKQEAAVRAAAGHLLVRGTIEPGAPSPFGNLGVLQGWEAWIGHPGTDATGTFYRARDTGIVCITYPCLVAQVTPLDRLRLVQKIAGIDLSGVGVDPADGYAQLDEPEGLLVAGTLVPVTGPAGTSQALEASEYYLPAAPALALCGASGLPACARREFCDFPAQAACGRRNVPGVCTTRPQACILLYDPVCGCDGRTWGNACEAAGAGVSVAHAGPCGG